jgi:hypothetical protein
MGALLWGSHSFAACEYKVDNSTYYFQGGAKYKISLKIDKVCSKNNIYKRELSGVTMKLFLKDTLVDELYFRRGFWQPDTQSFRLSKSVGSTSNCFKNLKSLNIDLKNQYINSLTGNYLNLSSGITSSQTCS